MPKKVRGTGAPEAGRRKFLKTAGFAGAAAAATIAMPQISRAQTTTFKMQGSWGAKDVFNEMAQDYVERVNKMAGGRLKIDYLVGGAVVHPFQVFDGVHGGQIDAAHTVTVYWYGKHKAASLFGTGPVFGFNANEGLGWIYNGGGKELYDELMTDIMKSTSRASSQCRCRPSRSAGSRSRSRRPPT
jgi:TRAP-type mannitol/chloroaromatic compound transport system substrate-binding protein